MKYLLVFLLGFTAHKAINYAYDYSSTKHFMSDTCKPIMMNGGNLTDRLECTYKEMGYMKYLAYTLLRPNVKLMSHEPDWIF